MAHFRAVIKGTRGEASRLGSKATSIYALVQTWGWDVLVEVQYRHGQDWAEITLVNHSTGERRHVLNLNLATGELAGALPKGGLSS